MTTKTLDFHGLTVEEALKEADRILCSVYLSNCNSICFITGKGEIYKELLKLMRNHIMVSEVKNDGLLGFLYRGRVEVVL